MNGNQHRPSKLEPDGHSHRKDLRKLLKDNNLCMFFRHKLKNRETFGWTADVQPADLSLHFEELETNGKSC
jgi:hypothetical protein